MEDGRRVGVRERERQDEPVKVYRYAAYCVASMRKGMCEALLRRKAKDWNDRKERSKSINQWFNQPAVQDVDRPSCYRDGWGRRLAVMYGQGRI